MRSQMPQITFETTQDFARQLDKEDELASFREDFFVADSDLIYLDGNSLGRLPQDTIQRMRDAVEIEWGQELIRGWNMDWYEAPGRVGEKIAQLIGAGPGQTVVSDSTSINLFKLVMGGLKMRPNSMRIVSDVLNFPTELYVLQGAVDLLGGNRELTLVPSEDGITVDQQTLLDRIDEQTALVALSLVAFKSGYYYDAVAVTKRAHEVGALVLWDLSHAAGAVEVALDAWGADMAVGCTYKYLNGGPGAPAFLYVGRGLQEEMLSPIWGWFGQQAPFNFDLDYRACEGINRFLVGSPPILSILAMESTLDCLLAAGMERIRKKSVLLTSYLVQLVDTVLKPLGFTLGSPRDPSQRGSHISIKHKLAYQICQALIEEMEIIPDFRAPDNIRLGLSPLYTSFSEVWEAIDRIRQVMDDGRHLRYPTERAAVT